MIVLDKERNLVKFETADEMRESAGFLDRLDPSEFELKEILGQYAFRDKIKCGLSNCRTLHNLGFMVGTIQGRVTNVGKDCGEKYFGVVFKDLTKQYEEDFKAQSNRQALSEFSLGLDEFESRIQELKIRDFGADWVYKRIVDLRQGRLTPEIVRKKLSEMRRSGNNQLTNERDATKAEMARAREAFGRSLSVVSENIAKIEGINVLAPENDLKGLLTDNLLESIKKFKQLDVLVMTNSDLKRWRKWTDSSNAVLEKAQAVVKEGNRFLTKKNLKPFEQLLSNENDKLLFKRIIESLK